MTSTADTAIFSYVDIEKDEAGWWVVKLGSTVKGGVPVRERVRCFEHSKLAPRAARNAAHDLAWHISETDSLQYLA